MMSTSFLVFLLGPNKNKKTPDAFNVCSYNPINPTHQGLWYRICRNKRPGRLIFRRNKKIPKAIGFMYSPLWKITHQSPSVLCSPPFEKSLFLVGAYFGVGVYFGKYGMYKANSLSWNRGVPMASRRRQILLVVSIRCSFCPYGLPLCQLRDCPLYVFPCIYLFFLLFFHQ